MSKIFYCREKNVKFSVRRIWNYKIKWKKIITFRMLEYTRPSSEGFCTDHCSRRHPLSRTSSRPSSLKSPSQWSWTWLLYLITTLTSLSFTSAGVFILFVHQYFSSTFFKFLAHSRHSIFCWTNRWETLTKMSIINFYGKQTFAQRRSAARHCEKCLMHDPY